MVSNEASITTDNKNDSLLTVWYRGLVHRIQEFTVELGVNVSCHSLTQHARRWVQGIEVSEPKSVQLKRTQQSVAILLFQDLKWVYLT